MQAHLQEASEKTAGIKKNEAMTLRNHNVNKNFKFLQSMRLQLHELLAACITINPHIKHLTAKLSQSVCSAHSF